MTTISVENYLKALYALGQRASSQVKTKALADHLGISPPSVTSMLKTLSQDGLVDYTRYKGARLTPHGERLALGVIRKHRLMEVFLVQTLGYTWDEVHVEAERLEHAVSDDLAARMERYLSFPQFDPHGDPIPGADGSLPTRQTVGLSGMSVGDKGCVVRVLDQNADVLQHLKRIGLVPGQGFEVEEILAYDGQMSLHLDGGSPVWVSPAVCALIQVEPKE